MKSNERFKAFIESVCGKFGIADAVEPLQKGFDLLLEATGDAPETEDWKSQYGDGGTTDHENSASGFYATPRRPIGYAILTNDVGRLEQLHSGNATSDEPWNTHGFSEDVERDGEFSFDFDRSFDEEFVKDWERVISGKTDNQAALRKMLEFKSDFFVCPMDFFNAYHAGYAKDLLASLLGNYFAAIDNQEDPNNSYLEWDNVTIGEMLDFLKDSSGAAPVAAVQEAAEGVDTQFVEIDDFPSYLVSHFANGTWGDFVQYYGQNAIDDLKNLDEFMTRTGLCDIMLPSTEEMEASYNSFNSHPAFGLATSTVKVYGVPGEWTPLAPQYEDAGK
jgi:hypothetical protein